MYVELYMSTGGFILWRLQFLEIADYGIVDSGDYRFLRFHILEIADSGDCRSWRLHILEIAYSGDCRFW